MAAADNFFAELESDSESEGEFEGFSSDGESGDERQPRQPEPVVGDDLFMRNWVEGDRPPVEKKFTGARAWK